MVSIILNLAFLFVLYVGVHKAYLLESYDLGFPVTSLGKLFLS